MINIIKKSDLEITDLYLKIDNLVNEIYGEDEDLRFRDPYGQLCEKLSHINESDANILLLDWAISRVENECNITFLKRILYVINKLGSYFWEYVKANQLKINYENMEQIKEILLNAIVSQELSMSERHTQNNFFERIVDFKNKNAWADLYEATYRASEWFEYFVDMDAVAGFKILLEYSQQKELEAVLDRLDISVLWGIFANIDTLDLLNFINKCESKFLIFTALSSIFPFNGSNHLDENLSIDELLVEVFVKAGSDLNFFSELLKIFNKYPSRYLKLQKILGKALAELKSEEVVYKYFSSMQLNVSKYNFDSRNHVKICLKEFEKNCNSKEFINIFWKIAYDVWCTWGFSNYSNNYLFGINFSLIDYAISKYYFSSFTLDEIEIIIENKCKEIEAIDDGWYLNESSMVTKWYYLWSEIQPICHARKMHLDISFDPLQSENLLYTVNINNYILFRFGDWFRG